MEKTNPLFALLPLLFCCHLLNAQWSPEIILTSDTKQGYTNPRIAHCDDNIVVTWGNSATGDIYLSRVQDGTSSIPQHINEIAPKAFVTDWASTAMASYRNSLVIVYKSKNAQTGSSFLYRSNDAAQTFSDPIEIIPGDSVLHRFPEVGLWDDQVYVSYMQFEPDWHNPQYYLIQSMDGGSKFSNPVQITGKNGAEACDCCISHIALSEDQLAVLYRNNDMNTRDMYAAVSSRDSINFNSHYDLNTPTWEIFQCPSTGGSGKFFNDGLHSVFASRHTGQYRIYYTVLDPQTGTLIQELAFPENPNPSYNYNFPKIAGVGDTIGVVWQTNLPGDADVHFTYSTNGAEGLGMEIYNIAENSLGRQINPDIVFNNGTFHFSWQDNATGNVKYRAFNIGNLSSLSDHKSASVKVFPNPSSNSFTINGITESDRVSIFDIYGRPVLLSNNQQEWFWGNSKDGLYTVVIQYESGKILTKNVLKVSLP